MFEVLSTPLIVVLFAIWFGFLLLSYKGQPKGLWTLALANTGERFGYYTMLAVFVLFLGDNFGFDSAWASETFSTFLSVVYLLPLFGGMMADKWGYSKMVVIGIFIMFFGYLLLSVPLGGGNTAIAAMCGGLLFVCMGTGLFKGNLQVMVGDLYNAPEFADKRDSGFSLFYMAINVGALFAPTAAIKVMEYGQSIGYSKADSYHFAFAVACVSVIASILVYYLGKKTFAQVINQKKTQASVSEAAKDVVEDVKDTKERIVCLCLVFAVVIFFWMAFHQNGLTLTWFADEFTATSSTGIESMMFDVRNLLACIFITYGLFGIFQSKGTPRILAGLLVAMGAYFLYMMVPGPDASATAVSAPIFQQFNACFVVMLTPVSIALFGWLGSKGKEPKAPVKIGLGMLVAASAYVILAMSSVGLPHPDPVNHTHMADVSPGILVNTYLILTFAELLLSPIGISFVTKVAPDKYKGMMMGGWFVATAIGNKVVSIPGHMWGMDLTIIWGVLACICLLAALFIFSIIKKLNKVS